MNYENFDSCTSKSSKENFNYYQLQNMNKKINAILVLIVIMMVGMFFSGCLYLRNRS